jgi:HEPN domain-containing protein
MSDSLAVSASLQVLQYAINSLFIRAKIDLPIGCKIDRDIDRVGDAISRAKEILNWSDNANIDALRVMFDRIKLSQQQKKEALLE